MEQPATASSPSPTRAHLLQRIVYLTRGELYQGSSEDNMPGPQAFRQMLIDRARAWPRPEQHADWLQMLEMEPHEWLQIRVLNKRSFSVVVAWPTVQKFKTPSQLFKSFKTFVAAMLVLPVQITDPSTFIGSGYVSRITNAAGAAVASASASAVDAEEENK